jgi:hypothetical protein
MRLLRRQARAAKHGRREAAKKGGSLLSMDYF